MVMKRSFGVDVLLKNEPFRVIEILVSVPMFLYGIYLLTPAYLPAEGTIFFMVDNGELLARVTGILYSLTGAAMWFAARSGKARSRQVSIMLFFAAMLYSAMFRITEIGFSLMSVLFIYIAVVLAAVDYFYLNGWRQESNH